MRVPLPALLLAAFLMAACDEAVPPPPPPPPNPAERATWDIPLDHHLLVDQFGYLPDAEKVAVIRDPLAGFDASDRFTPGNSYQVRNAATGEVAFAGAPVPWRGGAREGSSGDRGWWFDFSRLNAPGRYFVFDVERRRRSPSFEINAKVYVPVLKAALRMYFYQRAGIAKHEPQAEACWTDEAAYLGPHQDTEARDVTDQGNDAKLRDLSGGWFDAGDTNKYVTFAAQAVHQLLSAYAANPAAFTDEMQIPESGNGIPDVIDEVKWETDWLKKMQYPDGSLALKVGEIKYVKPSRPSADHSPRYYVPSCTSATIAGAGMFAHAAVVFATQGPLGAEAVDLTSRARIAWRNFQAASSLQTHCDTGVVHSGLADVTEEEQRGLAVEAAIYLYARTGETAFEDYVRQHYRDSHPYRDRGWSRYEADQGEALLYFTTLGAADGKLKAAILADKLADVRSNPQIYGFDPNADLYRAYLPDALYHWGSNNPRANTGTSNLEVATHALEVRDPKRYRLRALEMLHYFHGVNPFGMVYLTHMGGLGASVSANEIYHSWFAAGTEWSDAVRSACGPPPGYVPGGPNRNAAQDGVPTRLMPPTGQPPQKSYKDWNLSTPDASWAVTEPAIYFQSAYLRLLSAFVP